MNSDEFWWILMNSDEIWWIMCYSSTSWRYRGLPLSVAIRLIRRIVHLRKTGRMMRFCLNKPAGNPIIPYPDMVFKGFQRFSSPIHCEIWNMFLPRHGFPSWSCIVSPNNATATAARLLLGQSPVELRRTHAPATRGRRNPAKHEPTWPQSARLAIV